MPLYCTINDVEKTLAQTLTTASPDSVLTGLPGKLTSIGKKLKLGLIDEDNVYYYIRNASSHIDAALSQQYVTPLREKVHTSTTLAADLDEYATTISVVDYLDFVQGDIIYITDGTNEERHEVESITDNEITTVDSIINFYVASNTRILNIKFPDPIPFICARLACAAIYDKYARAQSEPSKTEYGNTLREEARAELNNIREGRTILEGIARKGWRFANPNLVARYTVKGSVESDTTRIDPGAKG